MQQFSPPKEIDVPDRLRLPGWVITAAIVYFAASSYAGNPYNYKVSTHADTNRFSCNGDLSFTTMAEEEHQFL